MSPSDHAAFFDQIERLLDEYRGGKTLREGVRAVVDEARAAVIAQRRTALITARLDLADAIRAVCLGPHSYVQHRDRQPAWCESCGYAEDGTRIHTATELAERHARLAAGPGA